MSEKMPEIRGADLVVEALRAEGVDTVFAYPGGMAIDLFDALYRQDDIDLVMPRHEQGLIFAADGYARTTGKVGVCLVTSGPGATNLVTGIANANYDSVPLVCLTGQVPRSLIGNDAFQEVDMVGICRNICKYAIIVRDRKDLGRILREAFFIARTGKPGPVVVDLPQDIQREMGSAVYPTDVSIRGYKPNTAAHPGQIKKAMGVLARAKKPVFLVGGGVHLAGAEREMQQLAEITGVPVITTIMGKGAIPTDHPLYVGNIGLHGVFAANQAISECDVLFSIGTRFNDRITGKISEFAKHATIIHVDIDTASISRNIVVDIPIVGDAKTAIRLMLEQAKPLELTGWVNDIMMRKKSYPINMNRYTGLTPQQIIQTLDEMVPKSILVPDVGQNQLWCTQYSTLGPGKRMITSGGLGPMGYSLPAAIGAALADQEHKVISVSGDGGFQMNLQELATAKALELPILVCVFNNTHLGNVRQMQRFFYGERYSSTCLRYRRSCGRACQNGGQCPAPDYLPDFIQLANSYECPGYRVTKPEEIRPVLAQALAHTGGPALVEFLVDEEEVVMPVVPFGKALNQMMLDY